MLAQAARAVAEFECLVLEGGGVKCAWQAGFLAQLKSEAGFNPSAISAVSASTALACAFAAGRIEFALACFKDAISQNRKNIYFSRLARGQRPFPQAQIYRQALLRAFDQASIEKLQSGPDIQVLVSRTAPNLPRLAGTAAGLCLWSLSFARKRPWYQSMHKRLGFCGELISVKSCSTPDELANLVLASSCTPPITPWYSIGGRPALDGGLVESIPLSGIPMRQARTLVLLTGARADLPTLEQTVFVSPASDAGIASWNYTDAGAIDRLYDRGARDAEMFIAKLSNGSIAKGSLPAEFPVCTTAPRAATGGR